jgi:DNA-binding transcriptional LysR family regulator
LAENDFMKRLNECKMEREGLVNGTASIGLCPRRRKISELTRAAEEINVSQSSLSQQVNKLESELGVRLFDRTTRKVKLTPAGVDFVRHANNVLQEIEEATRTIQEYLTVERRAYRPGRISAAGFLPAHVAHRGFPAEFSRRKTFVL